MIHCDYVCLPCEEQSNPVIGQVKLTNSSVCSCVMPTYSLCSHWLSGASSEAHLKLMCRKLVSPKIVCDGNIFCWEGGQRHNVLGAHQAFSISVFAEHPMQTCRDKVIDSPIYSAACVWSQSRAPDYSRQILVRAQAWSHDLENKIYYATNTKF